MLNRSGPKIDHCGTPDAILPIGYRRYHSLFSVCDFEDSYALALKPKVKNHKHLILQLTDHSKHR